MRISLFTHDANPGIDRPLCHKSKTYIARLILEKSAFMIDERRAQLYPPVAVLCVDRRDLMAAGREIGVQTSITDREMRANVGEADSALEILLAQRKVKAFPQVFDDYAPLARGSWPLSISMEVTA